MKIKVDPVTCQGHARCFAVAGDVYELNEEGYNRMGTFEVAPGLEAAATRGADECPERAIEIVEE
jgi:ferredoxin